MIKNVFITGAASGIGQATAEALYSQGWNLALADFDQDALERLSQFWDKNRVRNYHLDVRDFNALSAAISDFAETQEKRLQLLINCAGVLQIGRIESIAIERHKQILDINIQGTLNACLAALPYLRHTSNAQVINIGSITAIYGTPYFASYSMSKFAIMGLTEALNLEWQEYDIRVCDVLPPFINTPMFYNQGDDRPLVHNLGLELQAKDVTQVILKQIQHPRVHRAVGWQFQLTWALTQVLPRPLLRYLLQKLSR